jgi:hypothetical protein
MKRVKKLVSKLEIVHDTHATGRKQPLAIQNGCPYVFDGNRVTAHQSRDRLRQVVWWLRTADPDVSLFIGRDRRVRAYRRLNGHARLDLLYEFQTAFVGLKPLEQALQICTAHGHTWVSFAPTNDHDARGE